MRDEASAGARLEQFVRGLYFDLQRIDGVKPLEIWNGVREFFDPFEKANLAKNLYKIALPLVNEACFGRPFGEHAAAARTVVERSAAWFAERPQERMFDRFPDPPVGEASEKEVYRLVREHLHREVREAVGDVPPHPPRRAHGRAEGGADTAPGTLRVPAARGDVQAPPARPADALFPDGLFDFREMRIVDNEMPYIIFTDKEYRVIHGLAVVYLWLIDLDGIFCSTLEALGTEAALVEEYRKFVGKVHRENPLVIRGKRMDGAELSEHIHAKLQYEDYLDIFENVYRWFEKIREKLDGR
jgi:hypothetical protein